MLQLISRLVAEFQFSQSVYHMNENREVCICLELVSGTLVSDVIIEVSFEANEEEIIGSGSAAGCELLDGCY